MPKPNFHPYLTINRGAGVERVLGAFTNYMLLKFALKSFDARVIESLLNTTA